jgi:hypothetical protein
MAAFPQFRITAPVLRQDGRHAERVTAKLCHDCLDAVGICGTCGSIGAERQHAADLLRAVTARLDAAPPCRASEPTPAEAMARIFNEDLPRDEAVNLFAGALSRRE